MIQSRRSSTRSFILFLYLMGIFFVFPHFLYADTIEDLKSRISERNDNIKQLEEEIRNYQVQIDSVGRQANSLKNTLSSLALSRKKLEKSLAVTQNKIESTNLQIKELSLQINEKNMRIDDSKRVVSQALSSISETESVSILETFLGSHSFADLWNDIEELVTLQTNVFGRIHELQGIRTSLETNKAQTESKKKELLSLQNDLANQKKVIAETTHVQNTLLVETKNTESSYKKILSTKQAQKDAFEKELLAYEAALRIAIDPSKLPVAGNGILSYPVTKVVVTQYFGNTPFSTANPQVYNGKGHTGMDFAASIGTPIHAALSGTVTGVANTDLVPGCYSYGKWVMVKHANGLSTLYAHLSLQTVAVGDTVSTGDTIGYSGNTGYSTGPHLHFGVYATEGVRIMKFENSVNCKGATIPLADTKAYLNPLSYL